MYKNLIKFTLIFLALGSVSYGYAQTATTPYCENFHNNLRLGTKGSDVYRLQKFLNLIGFTVSPVGAGSPGLETNYFGPATFKAVSKYQYTYAASILLPYGLTSPTGFFGVSTRYHINTRCNSDFYNTNPYSITNNPATTTVISSSTSTSTSNSTSSATTTVVVTPIIYGGGGGGGGGWYTPPANTAPSAPTGLTFSNVSTSTLTLSWTPSSSGTTPITYRIISSPALIDATTTATSLNLSGFTASTSYSFTVTAINVAGSATSTSAATSTQAALVPPSAPTGLTFSNVSTSTLTLSWTPSSSGTTPITYRIISSPALIDATTTATSLNLSGFTASTSYSFTVTAINVAGSATSTSAATSTQEIYATTSTPIPTPAQGARTFYVGSGSGNLEIDGNNFIYNSAPVTLTNGDVIKINQGSYTNIFIHNINVASGSPVFIQNQGLVEIKNSSDMQIEEINNVIFSGDGDPSIEYGFQFKDITSRPLEFYKQMNNFTVKNVSFENIGDYAISYVWYTSSREYVNGIQRKSIAYNPSDPTTYSNNLRIYNIRGNNIERLIHIDGEIGTSTYGVVKNVEIAGLYITNSPTIGSAVWMGAVEKYDIHNNYISDINASNDNHNGVFLLQGNGKFYNNLVKNHQGNSVRAWPFSIDATGTVEIINNIAYNSRRYSGFEVQANFSSPPAFRPISSAKINSNSVGKMDTEIYEGYPGRLVDVYYLGPGAIIEAKDNLVFENNDNQIFNEVTDSPDITSNNIYVPNTLDAVVDTTNFVSKVPDTGAIIQPFKVK